MEISISLVHAIHPFPPRGRQSKIIKGPVLAGLGEKGLRHPDEKNPIKNFLQDIAFPFGIWSNFQ